MSSRRSPRCSQGTAPEILGRTNPHQGPGQVANRIRIGLHKGDPILLDAQDCRRVSPAPADLIFEALTVGCLLDGKPCQQVEVEGRIGARGSRARHLHQRRSAGARGRQLLDSFGFPSAMKLVAYTGFCPIVRPVW